MKRLGIYRTAGGLDDGQVLALAGTRGRSALNDARALLEAGRQNSVAMAVVPGGPPGRNVCALVRSLSRDRSRLIVAARPGGLPPGSFERMLRASVPDCEKRVRVIDVDGSLVEMISSAARNRHYGGKQALEVFCDRQLASGYAHDSIDPGLAFDPGLVSIRPIQMPSDDSEAIIRAVRGQDRSAQHRVLDAHIFSSPAGLAEYADALGPIGSTNESFLREFLSDISDSREGALAQLHALLSDEVDVDGLEYLGSGRNGSAYRSPEGFVLKVTTDRNEVRAAERLLGKSPLHLGCVFDVQWLTSHVCLLTQEDLVRLPEELRGEFDLAMAAIEAFGGMDDLNRGDLFAVVRCLAGAGVDAIPLAREVLDTMVRFGIPEMCAELTDLGLSGDFHSGNVMLRDGNPVLMDLGTPGEDTHLGTEACRDIGRRIDEFGSGAPGSGAAGPATMRGSNSSSWSNGRGALKSPTNYVPEDENADESDYALDWGPGRVSGASF